jgi:hypothetical protein
MIWQSEYPRKLAKFELFFFNFITNFFDEITSGGPNYYALKGNRLGRELAGVFRGACQGQGMS